MNSTAMIPFPITQAVSSGTTIFVGHAVQKYYKINIAFVPKSRYIKVQYVGGC